MESLFLVLVILSGPLTYYSIERPSQGLGCLAAPAILVVGAIHEANTVNPIRSGIYSSFAALLALPIIMALLARWVQVRRAARADSELGTGLNVSD